MMCIFFQLQNVHHLRVTFIMAMRRMFFIYFFKNAVIYLLCSWTHTDRAFCDYAFSFCVDRCIPNTPAKFPGASFVDIGLGVVVRQATGTMMAFQPEHLHGTTPAYGAINLGMAITFSRRVCEAFEHAKKLEGQVGVVSKPRSVDKTYVLH